MKTHELHSVSVQPNILSDGSMAWNVEQSHEDGTLIFACMNEEHARRLQRELRDCSWVTLENAK